MIQVLWSRKNLMTLVVAVLFVAGMTSCGGGGGGEQQAPPAGTPKRMIIETTQGTIVCELYPDKAPKTVNILSDLAQGALEWTHPETNLKMTNTPYFDGIIFHRVIPGFMIQTGDPLGIGRGGPGFTFDDEFHPDLQFDQPGRLGMANPGRPNSNGSQFFITVAETSHLNFKHTIFGQVVEGMDVAIAISQVATGAGDKPQRDVTIRSMKIERE